MVSEKYATKRYHIIESGIVTDIFENDSALNDAYIFEGNSIIFMGAGYGLYWWNENPETGKTFHNHPPVSPRVWKNIPAENRPDGNLTFHPAHGSFYGCREGDFHRNWESLMKVITYIWPHTEINFHTDIITMWERVVAHFEERLDKDSPVYKEVMVYIDLMNRRNKS